MGAQEAKPRFLPKWAQEEMDRKDRLIESLSHEVDQLRMVLSGDGKGMFGIQRMGRMHELFLDSDVRSMRIRMPNGFELDIQPDSLASGSVGRKEWIQVMVTSHHGLMVAPQAANVIHLAPGRD